MGNRLFIHNIPEISAIYFAMLHGGYDYYAIEKDAHLVKAIEGFRAAQCDCDISFFSQVKQHTCAVYPYWPRAAALETATFYMNRGPVQFRCFEAYQSTIMSASNIADVERNGAFWAWVKDFPSALASVLGSAAFHTYLSWENTWIARQNSIWEKALEHIQRILDVCIKDYASPIKAVSVVLNPIKCAYSSDYHMDGTGFFFSLGALRPESVIHEFLHHVVRPFVSASKAAIVQGCALYPGIDASYYLSHDEAGRLNAFEEYLVRCLTARVMANRFPSNLASFTDEILHRFC